MSIARLQGKCGAIGRRILAFSLHVFLIVFANFSRLISNFHYMNVPSRSLRADKLDSLFGTVTNIRGENVKNTAKK